MDVTSQTKTPNALFLTLELRVAAFAFPLSLFLQCNLAKEMLEGLLQVSQCLLRRTFRDFVHPGNVHLLERVEFLMQDLSIGCLSSCLVFLLVASESPIISIAGGTSMFETGRL